MSARERMRRRTLAVFGITLGITLGLAPGAYATVNTFTVDVADDPPFSIGDRTPDGCENNGCTLREAILATDDGDTTDRDVILFSSTLSDASHTLAGTQLPTIDEPLLIDGSATDPKVRVSGDGQSRILDIAAPGAIDVELKNFWLVLGNAGTGLGGAISAVDTDATSARPHLTLDGMQIEGNSAGQGGAIRASGIDLTIQDSGVSGNTAATEGGGIFAAAPGAIDLAGSFLWRDQAGSGGAIHSGVPITVDSSSLNEDVSTGTGPNGNGGAIMALGPVNMTDSSITDSRTEGFNAWGGGLYASGGATIERSALSGNQTQGDFARGAGALLSGDSTVENSTVYGNDASGANSDGGGLYLADFSGGHEAEIGDSTIASNHAARNGGGIVANDISPFILNSIMADNFAGPAPSPASELFSADDTFHVDFSLIEHATGATVAEQFASSNITGVDPALGPLQNLDRHLYSEPASDSVVIDCGATDQVIDERGETRPVDQANRANSTAAGADGSDMGAVEIGGNDGITGTCPNNPSPGVYIDDVTVDESDGTAEFTLSRTPGTGAASVNYGAASGTATAGLDFGAATGDDATPADGKLDFADGQTVHTVSVPITNDGADEPDETFVLNLSTPVGTTIADPDSQGLGTIVDDDLPASSGGGGSAQPPAQTPAGTAPGAAAPAPASTFNLKAAIAKCKSKLRPGAARQKCIRNAKRRAKLGV